MTKTKEAKVKTRVINAINELQFFEEQVRVVADACKAIGLPMFAAQLREEVDALDGKK